MAWTHWPISASTDITDHEVWDDLAVNVKLRADAAGLTYTDYFTLDPGDTVAAGSTYVFTAAWIAGVQECLEVSAPYFAAPDDADKDTYLWGAGGADRDITHSSQANVGNGNQDWTRKILGAGVPTDFGRAEVGDQALLSSVAPSFTLEIAPYLNEMYRVCNALRWIKKTGSFQTLADRELAYSTTGTSKANVRSTIVAAWPPATSNENGIPTFRAGQITQNLTGPAYAGFALTQKVNVQLTSVSTLTGADNSTPKIDIYVPIMDTSASVNRHAAGDPDAEWEWDGDNLLDAVEGGFSKITEDDTGSGTVTITVNDDASIPPEPTGLAPAGSPKFRGWSIDDASTPFGVLKYWD